MDSAYSSASDEAKLMERLIKGFKIRTALNHRLAELYHENEGRNLLEGLLLGEAEVKPHEEERYVKTKAEIQELEDRLRDEVRQHSVWKAVFASLPGFPLINAVGIIVTIRDINRFESLAALRVRAGVYRAISQCHPQLRGSLYFGAGQLIELNPEWKARYKARKAHVLPKVTEKAASRTPPLTERNIETMVDHMALWWVMGKIVKHIWETWPRQVM